MKRLVAATLALALTAAACGGDDAADSTEVAEPTPAETVEAEPTATPEPDQDEAPAEDVIETSAFVADAEVLTAMFSPVEPGTYRVDTLGTPFSITLDETTVTQRYDDWGGRPSYDHLDQAYNIALKIQRALKELNRIGGEKAADAALDLLPKARKLPSPASAMHRR